jgi:hypothetical protein
MKIIFYRLIAVLLLAIPGIGAAYGFLLMKDSLFLYFSQFGDGSYPPQLEWGKFLIGLILFAAGVAFIGGWIFFRDRKRNYVAPRFKAKKK